MSLPGAGNYLSFLWFLRVNEFLNETGNKVKVVGGGWPRVYSRKKEALVTVSILQLCKMGLQAAK